MLSSNKLKIQWASLQVFFFFVATSLQVVIVFQTITNTSRGSIEDGFHVMYNGWIDYPLRNRNEILRSDLITNTQK